MTTLNPRPKWPKPASLEKGASAVFVKFVLPNTGGRTFRQAHRDGIREPYESPRDHF